MLDCLHTHSSPEGEAWPGPHSRWVLFKIPETRVSPVLGHLSSKAALRGEPGPVPSLPSPSPSSCLPPNPDTTSSRKPNQSTSCLREAWLLIQNSDVTCPQVALPTFGFTPSQGTCHQHCACLHPIAFSDTPRICNHTQGELGDLCPHLSLGSDAAPSGPVFPLADFSLSLQLLISICFSLCLSL